MAEKTHQIVAPVPVYLADQSLLSALAKELNEERERTFNLTRNLALEKHKTQQLECYFMSLIAANETKSSEKDEPKKKITKIESCETFGSLSDLTETKSQVGIYSASVRLQKIKKYKEKVKKYRQKVHISRNFGGRSVVAKIKPRVNGKFIKSTPQETPNP